MGVSVGVSVGVDQGERSENVVLHCTSRLCHNCTSDLFSYFKSTIDLCYSISAEVHPT